MVNPSFTQCLISILTHLQLFVSRDLSSMCGWHGGGGGERGVSSLNKYYKKI